MYNSSLENLFTLYCRLGSVLIVIPIIEIPTNTIDRTDITYTNQLIIRLKILQFLYLCNRKVNTFEDIRLEN